MLWTQTLQDLSEMHHTCLLEAAGQELEGISCTGRQLSLNLPPPFRPHGRLVRPSFLSPHRHP